MGFPPHLDYLKEKEIVWFNPCWGYYAFGKGLMILEKRIN